MLSDLKKTMEVLAGIVSKQVLTRNLTGNGEDRRNCSREQELNDFDDIEAGQEVQDL